MPAVLRLTAPIITDWGAGGGRAAGRCASPPWSAGRPGTPGAPDLDDAPSCAARPMWTSWPDGGLEVELTGRRAPGRPPTCRRPGRWYALPAGRPGHGRLQLCRSARALAPPVAPAALPDVPSACTVRASDRWRSPFRTCSAFPHPWRAGAPRRVQPRLAGVGFLPDAADCPPRAGTGCHLQPGWPHPPCWRPHDPTAAALHLPLWDPWRRPPLPTGALRASLPEDWAAVSHPRGPARRCCGGRREPRHRAPEVDCLLAGECTASRDVPPSSSLLTLPLRLLGPPGSVAVVTTLAPSGLLAGLTSAAPKHPRAAAHCAFAAAPTAPSLERTQAGGTALAGSGAPTPPPVVVSLETSGARPCPRTCPGQGPEVPNWRRQDGPPWTTLSPPTRPPAARLFRRLPGHLQRSDRRSGRERRG